MESLLVGVNLTLSELHTSLGVAQTLYISSEIPGVQTQSNNKVKYDDRLLRYGNFNQRGRRSPRWCGKFLFRHWSTKGGRIVRVG